MNKKADIVCYLISILVFSSCFQASDNASKNEKVRHGWQVVYKNDEKGNQLVGNIDSLIAGIRSGYDVRVGWGWQKKSGDSILKLEHMAEPLFLSIIQEKEVSIVIDAHPLLESYIDINSQNISEGGNIWQCVLTTKGTFNAQVYSRVNGKLLKDWPQHQKITWFLEYPMGKRKKTKPLY